MKFGDLIGFATRNLRTRKLRSWLTIIGIVIGVAAVVTLVSLAQGLSEFINSQLSTIGSDIVTVIPGFVRSLEEFRFGGFESPRVGELTENDAKIIKNIDGVLYVNSGVGSNAEISYRGEKVTIEVNGIDPETWKFVEFTGLEEGRYLSSGDKFVAVLGSSIANDVFKGEVTLNKQITISGKTFKVVGVLKKAGLFGAIDSNVFIPKDVARDLFSLDSQKLSFITVKVSDTGNNIEEKIEKRLFLSHHVTKDNQDFTIITPESIQETVNRISTTVTFFWGGIAAISLIVGGVGIANTMFMSVIERIRQIGILKALGATKRDVMKIFIVESSLIGLVGGLIGIFIALIIVSGVSAYGFTTPFGDVIIAKVTPELLGFAVLFSIFIGTVSGLFPAKRAAELEPIEALRYE